MKEKVPLSSGTLLPNQLSQSKAKVQTLDICKGYPCNRSWDGQEKAEQGYKEHGCKGRFRRVV